jgi:hypothetical protein
MTIRLIQGVVAAAFCCALPLHAQQMPDESTAVYQTPEGQLTVHSGQPAARRYAPPPPFEQLANGKSYITSADAAGYDLLANDFRYADSNHDGRVSRAEYERWVRAG